MSAKASQAFPNATIAPEGMVYKGVVFQPIIDKCEGCARISEFEGQKYCSSYAIPSSKWSLGMCNFATHIKSEVKAQGKVNPLKASKRASKKH